MPAATYTPPPAHFQRTSLFFFPFWNTVGPEIQQKILKKMWQAVNLICRYYLSTMHYFNSSTCLYLLKTRVRPEWLRYPSALLTTAAKSPTPETAQCRKQHRNAISKHQNSNKINQRPVECTQLFYWKSKLWKIIIKSFHPELVLLHFKKKKKKKHGINHFSTIIKNQAQQLKYMLDQLECMMPCRMISWSIIACHVFTLTKSQIHYTALQVSFLNMFFSAVLFICSRICIYKIFFLHQIAFIVIL